MLQVALVEPEIPPNTGNVGRLCAATGARLHLVGRLGFQMDDKTLRRAGMDYWQHLDWHRHAAFADFEEYLAKGDCAGRLVCFTTRTDRPYTSIRYQPGDCLVFGSESRGLAPEILSRHHALAVTLPMPGKEGPAGRAVRSINLATAVAVGLYEGLRQIHGWQGPA
mgnify:CR=1 FL=1